MIKNLFYIGGYWKEGKTSAQIWVNKSMDYLFIYFFVIIEEKYK